MCIKVKDKLITKLKVGILILDLANGKFIIILASIFAIELLGKSYIFRVN